MPRIQTAMLVACCWTLAVIPLLAETEAATPGLSGGDRLDLVTNGSFATDSDPWFALKREGDRQVRAPEMLAIETNDVPAAGTGALRVTIEKDPGVNWPSHNFGIVCPLREHLPADREATLVVWAKSLSGARVLSIGRLGGGGNATIAIEETWNRYEVPLRFSHQAGDLLFNLVPKASPGIQAVEKGEFLLADLSVVAELPQATAMDVRYGPHSRQTFDVWRAPETVTAPVLVFIHGGGWLGGDKKDSPGFRATVAGWHARGISVANVNYRYSSDAPLPAPVHDAARAIQMMRSMAREWGIDKARIAATGDSAGGCTTLWLATHDDLADPAAEDPVARESTRLCGAIVVGAQTTIDPVVIRNDVFETALAHQMICRGAGFRDNRAMDEGYEQARGVYVEFSPINHLSKDDPPVWMSYHGPVTDPGEGIHSSRFGVIFKRRADEVGVPCWLDVRKNPELYPKGPDMQTFIVDVLKPEGR